MPTESAPREPRRLGSQFRRDATLPTDLTPAEYRRRARATLQESTTEASGPRADRLVAQAHVLALCALSATREKRR